MRAMAMMAVTGDEIAVAVVDGLTGANSAELGEEAARQLRQGKDGINIIYVLTAGLDLAEFDPVIPHTQRVYGKDLDVTVNVVTNEMTLTSGAAWDARGFITGGQFSIAAPNRNKGTYTATVTPASLTILLSDNELELSGGQVLTCQQVIVPTDYIPLLTTQAQLALRQLARRRSSHTGLVA